MLIVSVEVNTLALQKESQSRTPGASLGLPKTLSDHGACPRVDAEARRWLTKCGGCTPGAL